MLFNRRKTLSLLAGSSPLCTISLAGQNARGDDPADLSGREGNDWTSFLGPTADSVLPGPELPLWSKSGPPVVWEIKLGEGYAPPSVWKGRVFIYDRTEKGARVRSLELKTGNELMCYRMQHEVLGWKVSLVAKSTSLKPWKVPRSKQFLLTQLWFRM